MPEPTETASSRVSSPLASSAATAASSWRWLSVPHRPYPRCSAIAASSDFRSGYPLADPTLMSGVTGASFRSNVGSPACTATVSECSIGSAYLKAFEAAELLYIAESFEDGEAGVHLIMIAGEQRPFAADSRGVWQSP